jgi:hypothetical protein
MEIILKIPNTDNVRIHEDFASAALAMPARVSARIVPKAREWVTSPYQLLLPQKLGALVQHLAEGGEDLAAIDLASSLLSVLPDPRSPTSTEETRQLPPHPRPLFDAHTYEEILKQNVPPLVAAVGRPAFNLLLDLLEKVVVFSRLPSDKAELEDYSYIWRPTIEDHPQNLDVDVRHFLVSAVRDASDLLIRRGLLTTIETVRALEQRRWPIFRRLALHILREFADSAGEVLDGELANRSHFDDIGLRHEYARLLRTAFGRLTEASRQTILRWITEGPDIDRVKSAGQAVTGTVVSDEDAARYAEIWRRDRLAVLDGQLPPAWQTRYQDLVQQFGPSEVADFVQITASYVGPTSPRSAEELRAMTTEQVLDFLRTWAPQQGEDDPSPEGLSRILHEIVASEPQKFAVLAAAFTGVDPTYVRGLLAGLRDALQAGLRFEWEGLLGLGFWVTQPRDSGPHRPVP